VVDTPAFDPALLLARLGVMPRRITSDSRRVDRGAAFAAYPGARTDGRAHIAEALARGAQAVLWEAHGFQWRPEWAVPQQAVEGLAAKLGAIADRVYGSPSQSLWMVGITGTNGKTSCSHWIAQAVEACGRRAAVIGTLGNGRLGALAPSPTTTPDVCALHEILAQLGRGGVTVVAMEVSSHGLDQGRVNHVAFDVALFTNLSRDHLDYHGTMVAYGQAKEKLFAWPGLHSAVVNADDAFGQRLIDGARAHGRRVISYGLGAADVAGTAIAGDGAGIALSVATPWGRGTFTTGIVGAFNAQNLLGVLAVLLESDVRLSDALDALATLTPPAGRMQRLGGDGKPLVVVDYAHTPDALEKVLLALKPAVAPGRELVAVFGCGGDRDSGKRPEMGRIAGTLAERVIITNDNPRAEDPSEIASAIVRGIRQTASRRWTIELDRAQAIHGAIAAAGAGDVILVAGKGHETHQETQGAQTPFSDAAEAAAALAAWSGL
jgi:UDP-N-acetylmuramoyl-L-alanyl-D-glutamate--2,6-diaminopimelate ligase